jgi:hypothetical protein
MKYNSKYIEPHPAYWHDPAVYNEILMVEFIHPLQTILHVHGVIPKDIQMDVLLRLHWYFTVDMRERSPTVMLAKSRADSFHEYIHQIMRHVDMDSISALHEHGVHPEVCHALLSYHDAHLSSAIMIDTYDHDQNLMRLSYYIHGQPPIETFKIDGQTVLPVYEKYRGCLFFHRICMRQRIIWFPVPKTGILHVWLDRSPHSLEIDSKRSSFYIGREGHKSVDLFAVKAAYPPSRKGRGIPFTGVRKWKAKLLCWLADSPPVRRYFRDAWVFADRDRNADDNAEHLYRWVREHHPEINAWFLLAPTSPDWVRLANDGFKLMRPGILRKLLILNSKNIISSHTDYAFGGMDRTVYGNVMRWRYIFLQHGVIIHDLSHWLGSCEIDLFITSSPAEHASIVDNDSNYPYTNKEVFMTGLSRHDRLIKLSRLQQIETPKQLLVMPTWRAMIFHGKNSELSLSERKRLFAQSDYLQKWRSLLHNKILHASLERNGWRIVFMPHFESTPYLDIFDPPPIVDIVRVTDTSIQNMFINSAALLTDYTSATFDMALLRKAVFYYQFDRDYFYGGGHIWRKGYFDYERDGFGPVCTSEAEIVDELGRFLNSDATVAPMYLARMMKAMPFQDEMACQRIFDSITRLRLPYGETLI